MKTPIQSTTDQVTTTWIEPTDSRVVHFRATARLGDYETDAGSHALLLYTRLLEEGAGNLDKKQFEETLKRHGIVFTVSAGLGIVTFALIARRDVFNKACELLELLIKEPTLPPHRLLLHKKRILEEIRETEDDASYRAKRLFINSLFPSESPYYQESSETLRKTVMGVSHRSLQNITKKLFSAEWFFTISGDKTSKDIFTQFISTLVLTPAQPDRNIPLIEQKESSLLGETIPDKVNVEVFIGNVLPFTGNDRQSIAFEMGLMVLGYARGFSGRLMKTVRVKEGLTYGIYASLLSQRKGRQAYWRIETFFSGTDLKSGLECTQNEIYKIVKQGITEKELSMYQTILQNEFQLQHESNLQRVKFYHGAILKGLTVHDLEARQKEFNTLTRREVNESLRTFLDPQRLVIRGAGPITQEGHGIPPPVTF